MTPVEARAFLLFLDHEERKHKNAIEHAKSEIANSNKESQLEYALNQFYASAILRDEDDLQDIALLRIKVKRLFGWL
jgi:hypothetical protein